MDIGISLSDLTYSYEDLEKINSYQSYIASKYEFSSLQGIDKYKGLFRHQEIIKRLILFTDRLLLFHKTGTGKSCASFGSSEAFANDFLNLVDDFVLNYVSVNRSTVKRIYYLTKGPTLINSARKELVCYCTKDKYITEEVLESTTSKIFRFRIKREVAKYYNFDTYYGFASGITEEVTDQEIIDNFSNCMFIVDEVQTLSVNDEGSKNDEKEQNLKTYNILHRVFHLVKNSKIILMSATPMVDKPKEIEGSMNLILPLDNQMNIADYKKVTIEELRPYFRGNVSFVGDFQTNETAPIFKGHKIKKEQISLVEQYQGYPVIHNNINVIVSEHLVSEFQEQIYIKVSQNNQGRFYAKERQILNMVFPNESYEGELPKFSSHVAKLGPDRYQFKDKEITKDTFKIYSAKGDYIVNESITGVGNRFVYSNFVKMGVLILACAFKLYGVDQYIGATSAFTTSKKATQRYCSNVDENQKDKKILIDKRLRFAIISTDTTQVQIERIFELFNSYENRYGEYIKIIIGSPKTQIGISLLSILGVHIFDPHWNFSNIYQAFSRGYRRDSFRYILDIIAKNHPLIFLNCAIMRSRKIPTIDLILYVRGEEKDIDIKRIERFIKILSVDCFLNNPDGPEDNPNDYSNICDYQKCKYICYDQKQSSTQYDSFNVLYSSELLDKIIAEIKELFRVNFIISIPALIESLKTTYTNKQILLAIERLYDQKRSLINRYGFESYIYVAGNYLMIYNGYPETQRNPNETISVVNYSQINLFAKDTNNIDSYLFKANMDSVSENIKKFRKLKTIDDNNFEVIFQWISKLSIEKQSILLEMSCIQKVLGKETVYDTMVLEYFKRYLLELIYPLQAILDIRRYLETRKRKKLSSNMRVLDELEYIGTDKVYLNTLLVNSTDRASYRVTVKTINNNLRILIVPKLLKGNINGFRYADNFETIIFNHLVNEKETIPKNIKDQDIYGSLSHADNNFRIYLKEEGNEKESDSRTKVRGRKCMTFSIVKLITILLSLDVSDNETTNIRVTLSKQELVDFLLSKDVPESEIKTASLGYLKAFYNWITRRSKEDICNEIMNKLKLKGLLLND